MASAMNGTGSSGSNGSDGDGKRPNDRKGHLSPKSHRQKQEEFDALRRREEGMQLLKLFRVQKWFLAGALNFEFYKMLQFKSYHFLFLKFSR